MGRPLRPSDEGLIYRAIKRGNPLPERANLGPDEPDRRLVWPGLAWQGRVRAEPPAEELDPIRLSIRGGLPYTASRRGPRGWPRSWARDGNDATEGAPGRPKIQTDTDLPQTDTDLPTRAGSAGGGGTDLKRCRELKMWKGVGNRY